jgi:hypothetical protein
VATRTVIPALARTTHRSHNRSAMLADVPVGQPETPSTSSVTAEQHTCGYDNLAPSSQVICVVSVNET